MIERKIRTSESFGTARNGQHFAALLDVKCTLANRANKSCALFFPMKNLAAVEREREIEVGSSNGGEAFGKHRGGRELTWRPQTAEAIWGLRLRRRFTRNGSHENTLRTSRSH